MKLHILLPFVFGIIMLTACNNSSIPDHTVTKVNDSTENGYTDTVELYFIRHGKTMFNTTGQVQGWCDSPLTDIGIDQAEQSAKGLRDVTFATAYSSDLGRARHTAEIILAGSQSPVIPELKVLAGLREWGYGGYEGRDNSTMWDPLFEQHGLKFDEDWSQWDTFASIMSDEEIADAIADNDPTGTAEDYDSIVKRSQEAVELIVQETLDKGGGKALVISHGSEIPTILSIFVPDEDTSASLSNCSLTVLRYADGVYTLVKLGDMDYMNE